MNMFEEARALWGTMKTVNMTQEQLASRLGVSQSYLANKLRLLRLSLGVQDEIVRAGLSERHARAILRLGSEDQQLFMIRRVKEDSLSVAQTEQIVDALLTEGDEGSVRQLCERMHHVLHAYSSLLSNARITRVTEEEGDTIKLTFILEKTTPSTSKVG